MRIIFVRHGHPNYQDDCLTELGKLQAEAVAERLKDEPVSRVFTSTMGRAKETGEYIAKKHNLEITALNFMRELSWGSRDGSEILHGGHPWFLADTIAARGDSLTRADWKESEYFSNSVVSDRVKMVCDGLDGWLATLGYEREGDYYRTKTANDDTIVLASHGGSSSAALSHILNIPFPLICAALRPQFTSITIVNFHGEDGALFQPKIEVMNDFSHIKGIQGELVISN